MSLPDDLKYAETHEWVRVESDGTLTVGITEHAQESLGDIVSFELPGAGKVVAAGEVVATVESVKAASEIHAPVSGQIVESNALAQDDPGSVNTDPYGTWLFRLAPQDLGEVDGLMSAMAYSESVGE
ncbi:glycine cleavage system protein GcvH [Paraburkholderia sp. GAS334]|uniref:glycine cleavage system protein GcvH n=1 Tax=Paraburkholderia sp. GAS334 TaxID=3035131 RepID=UPI003D23FEDA